MNAARQEIMDRLADAYVALEACEGLLAALPAASARSYCQMARASVVGVAQRCDARFKDMDRIARVRAQKGPANDS